MNAIAVGARKETCEREGRRMFGAVRAGPRAKCPPRSRAFRFAFATYAKVPALKTRNQSLAGFVENKVYARRIMVNTR
jgi:hypothetical protein